MHRPLKPTHITKIQRAREQGYSFQEIARSLRLSKNQTRKVCRQSNLTDPPRSTHTPQTAFDTLSDNLPEPNLPEGPKPIPANLSAPNRLHWAVYKGQRAMQAHSVNTPDIIGAYKAAGTRSPAIVRRALNARIKDNAWPGDFDIETFAQQYDNVCQRSTALPSHWGLPLTLQGHTCETELQRWERLANTPEKRMAQDRVLSASLHVLGDNRNNLRICGMPAKWNGESKWLQISPDITIVGAEYNPKFFYASNGYRLSLQKDNPKAKLSLHPGDISDLFNPHHAAFNKHSRPGYDVIWLDFCQKLGENTTRIIKNVAANPHSWGNTISHDRNGIFAITLQRCREQNPEQIEQLAPRHTLPNHNLRIEQRILAYRKLVQQAVAKNPLTPYSHPLCEIAYSSHAPGENRALQAMFLGIYETSMVPIERDLPQWEQMSQKTPPK